MPDSGVNGCKGVGNCQFAVVVRVYTYRDLYPAYDAAGNLLYFMR
jgi:hypothetical protein